jgi:hypothetical protein
MSSPCEQKDVIHEINKRLSAGELVFSDIKHCIDKINLKIDMIAEKQNLVIEQTTRTNGRVTKLEQTKRAMWWIFIGIAASLVIQTVGLKAAIVKFALGS